MKKVIFSFLAVCTFGFSAILQVTEKNFDQIENSKKPVIIDVTAPWCGACKKLEPTFKELSEKYKDQILFAKIDADSQNELATRYQIQSLPTILFIKAGQTDPSMQHVGAMNKTEFEAKINDFLKNK